MVLVGSNKLFAQSIELVIEFPLFPCRETFHLRQLDALVVSSLLSQLYTEVVVIASVTDRNSVACRIVEHHDISQLDIAKPLYTTILPLRPFNIRFAVEERKSMLGERHREWGLWNTRPVAHLTHEKVVAREE